MDDVDLLRAQTRHVYDWLTRATEDVDAAAARVHLGGDAARPTVAWIVGHLLAEAESTAEAVTGFAPTYVADPQTHGAAPDADWTALRAAWLARSAACLDAFQGVTSADLDAPPRVAILPEFADHLTDRRRFWSGHVFHMAYHLGQLGSLRAELGLGWWS